jgi:hypothetical protein
VGVTFGLEPYSQKKGQARSYPYFWIATAWNNILLQILINRLAFQEANYFANKLHKDPILGKEINASLPAIGNWTESEPSTNLFHSRLASLHERLDAPPLTTASHPAAAAPSPHPTG